MLKIYAYRNCDSCRRALKWLAAREIAGEVIAIREHPPQRAELALALEAHGGDPRPLFNTSGADYRELGLKDRLPGMTRDDVVDLLSRNGNLVKRPFVIGGGIILAGFKEAEWERKFR